jgi:hypothetical protein
MEDSPVRRLLTLASAFLVVAAAPAAAVTETPAIKNIILTSAWAKASPDPMGLAYRKSTDTVLVVDSEVEEIPALWQGVNFWEMSRDGSVVATGSTIAFSPEPADVAFRPNSAHVYISDDDQDAVFDVNVGPDHKMGTSDDTVRTLSTRAFGNHDPEGIGYGHNALFITDGVHQLVYRLKPGRNGYFDGVAPAGDDRVSHFSTNPLGLHDPEDVVYDQATDSLFIVSRFDKLIVQTTRGGAPLRTFDLSTSGILQPAGIAIALSSTGRGRSMYVADRGYDNNLHPNENDGRIFEFKLRRA